MLITAQTLNDLKLHAVEGSRSARHGGGEQRDIVIVGAEERGCRSGGGRACQLQHGLEQGLQSCLKAFQAFFELQYDRASGAGELSFEASLWAVV